MYHGFPNADARLQAAADINVWLLSKNPTNFILLSMSVNRSNRYFTTASQGVSDRPLLVLTVCCIIAKVNVESITYGFKIDDLPLPRMPIKVFSSGEEVDYSASEFRPLERDCF